MAQCDVSKGKSEIACKNTVSGIKSIVMANYGDYDFVTSSTLSGQSLTSLGTLTGSTFQYALKNTGNNFSQAGSGTRDTGTSLFTQTLTFILTQLSAEMEFQVKMFVWGRPIIFVQMQTDQWFVMGMENGCEINTVSGIAGAMDGLNGYTMTAVGTEREPIFYLTTSAVNALLATISTDNIEN